jgi:hypothetical protein
MVYLLVAMLAPPLAGNAAAPQPINQQQQQQQQKGEEEKLTPTQKMQRRFPQPVRVGRLIGMPVLDYDDSTIGYVKAVVRSPQGNVFLIVPYRAWFGWLDTEWGKRPVAVPVEVVAILGYHLNALEMTRKDFDEAPTWSPGQSRPIPREETTPVALGRR